MGSATSKGKNFGESINKISTIRYKRNNPSFQKQQDSAVPSGQQQGDSAKDEEKGHGKCGGKKQREKKEKKHLNFIESKDFRSEGTSSYFVYTTAIPAVVEPCVAAHQPVQLYQGTSSSPIFAQTQESFDFAHHLGIEPLMKCIHSLDATLLLLKWVDFSSPVVPSPSSFSLVPPPAPSLPPLVSCIEIISEDSESIV